MKNSIAPTPKGILFDMDGVLLVETQSPHQSWQQVCQQFAPILDLSPENLLQALNESRHVYKEDIERDTEKQRRDRLEPFATRRETVARALQTVGRQDITLATNMVHAYEALRDEHRQPAPSALDTLQKLQKSAISLALISNGNATYQRRKMKQHHLVPFFRVILIEEEFGVAKPDQRIFLHAIDQLHISAQEAWMIGDDLAFDIAGSQQLGIFAIWCDFARRGLSQNSPVQPDWTIHALPELFDLYEYH